MCVVGIYNYIDSFEPISFVVERSSLHDHVPVVANMLGMKQPQHNA